MDYEKAYKEALERARVFYETKSPDCLILESIFPEFHESEDERIRKELIKIVGKFKPEVFSELTMMKQSDIIAWLEKQGEEKVYSVWVGGSEINDYYLTEKEAKKLAREYKENGYDDVIIEKQGKQKPFDYENANIPQKDFAPKAEPKFKVGNWIYHEISRNTIHINKIENGLYVSDEGATISFGRQNDWRLWTIEDAKDGDVLKGYGECYILFKELKDGNLISYCDFSKSKFHSWEEVDWAFQMFDPTTEYQRINFFQKMHEAGYTWDAKTKQLIKIQS